MYASDDEEQALFHADVRKPSSDKTNLGDYATFQP
jgi:hypothetical protein